MDGRVRWCGVGGFFSDTRWIRDWRFASAPQG